MSSAPVISTKISLACTEHLMNGLRHRFNGPAVIHTRGPQKGLQTWYQNGLKHRVDGPARIYPTGSIKQYFLFDIEIPASEFAKLQSMLATSSDQEKTVKSFMNMNGFW